MSRPLIKIVEVDGTEIEREMNDEEYAQWEADVAADIARVAEFKSALEKKEAAEAKLAALGLTADDLKALGLG